MMRFDGLQSIMAAKVEEAKQKSEGDRKNIQVISTQTNADWTTTITHHRLQMPQNLPVPQNSEACSTKSAESL